MNLTSIQWTDVTWNPVRGCSRVSPGCEHCYAETMAARFSDHGMWGHGFAERTEHGGRWTRLVEPVPTKLEEPLRLRKPHRIFVNSTSDLFHESVPNEYIASVFGVMAACPQHVFQILTKRAERMALWFAWVGRGAEPFSLHSRGWRICAVNRSAAIRSGVQWPSSRQGVLVESWPLPNVWIGVSVEDQRRADERIPHLLGVPAAVRFLSIEPLLEAVDLGAFLGAGISWVIVGGESGHGARPFDVAWARSIIAQCREAKVACFVKQLGAQPVTSTPEHPRDAPLVVDHDGDYGRFDLRDRKGGDPSEWPKDLRVREMPGGEP